MVDALGNPLAFTLSGANVTDISAAQPLIEKVSHVRLLVADRGYDSDDLIAWLDQRGIQAIIAPRSNRRFPRTVDWHRYNARHLVERTFNWIQHFRRVSTRFEKLDLHYAAMINLAGVGKWLA